ncbi:MAG TPA: hypothetical protein VE868_11670 [Balneolaceae bacterium]|nr:hypothetical protein [Balneolaceae bacterium]
MTDPSQIYSRQFAPQKQLSSKHYEVKRNAASDKNTKQNFSGQQPANVSLKLYGNSGKIQSKKPAIRGTKIDIKI